MAPTKLAILDFDGTLYSSPGPPDVWSAPSWYFQPKSLGEWGPPGFDPRWILPVLTEARRHSFDPETKLVVLTARTHTNPMVDIIRKMLAAADLNVSEVKLRPLLFSGSDARFKANAVAKWLRDSPGLRHVKFYDDKPENLYAVGKIVEASGREYAPVQAPGFHAP